MESLGALDRWPCTRRLRTSTRDVAEPIRFAIASANPLLKNEKDDARALIMNGRTTTDVAARKVGVGSPISPWTTQGVGRGTIRCAAPAEGKMLSAAAQTATGFNTRAIPPGRTAARSPVRRDATYFTKAIVCDVEYT